MIPIIFFYNSDMVEWNIFVLNTERSVFFAGSRIVICTQRLDDVCRCLPVICKYYKKRKFYIAFLVLFVVQDKSMNWLAVAKVFRRSAIWLPLQKFFD